MAISFIEQLILKKIRSDMKTGEINSLLISMLSFEGAMALEADGVYKSFYYKYFNDKTAFRMLDYKIKNEFDKKNAFEIFSLFGERSNSFLEDLYEQFPDEMIILLLANRPLSYKNISLELVDKMLLRFFDNMDFYRNYEFYLHFHTLEDLVVKSSDDVKIKFLNKKLDISLSNVEIFLGSFKDKKLLKTICFMLLDNFSISFDVMSIFLNFDEIFDIAKDIVVITKSYSKYSEFFEKFDLQHQLILLDCMLKCSVRGIDDFINVIIDKMLCEGNYNCYGLIKDMYINNGRENDFNIRSLNPKIIEYINSLDSKQLVQFCEKNNCLNIIDYILSDEMLWFNEDFLLYLINNEPVRLNEIFNSSFVDELPADKVELLSSKELAKNMLIAMKKNYCDFIYNSKFIKIRSYFDDIQFCRDVIYSKNELFTFIFDFNHNLDLLNYAIDLGFVPDVNSYSSIKDYPEAFNIWFEYFAKYLNSTNDFPTFFKNFSIIDDENITSLLLNTASVKLDMPYEDFIKKFNYIKKFNRDLIKTFDYRLFSSKFSFLTIDKIEVLGAHDDVSTKLCSLNDYEIEIIGKLMTYASTANWIDLLDRILKNINDYRELVVDLQHRELSVPILDKLLIVFSQANKFDITNIENVINYDNLINQNVDRLIRKNTIESYKEAISLKLLGDHIEEFTRIYNVYCSDLKRFKENCSNSELYDILELIRNTMTCESLEKLKEIFDNIPKIICDSCFLVNLDSEIRKEFARMYNETLYKVDEKDKIKTLKYKENFNNKDEVFYEVSQDGIEVSFYDPSNLFNNQMQEKQFGLMMTSLGAYSNIPEPSDYYASWNMDLIRSHGFCCSYLTNDNLGTAMISYACLGFTDFDPEALLFSAPYDIVSNVSNTMFNTTRYKETKFCTPRGMIDNTRHTHNEVVWERRNINNPDGPFKKEPAYVIFFCENFEHLSDDEKKVFNSTIKASIQLGKEEALPVVIIDREKIAKSQRSVIEQKLLDIFIDYKENDIQSLICLLFNNIIGNFYANGILTKYFNVEFGNTISDYIHLKIMNLYNSGNFGLAKTVFDDYCKAFDNESAKTFVKGFKSDMFKNFNDFRLKMNLLFDISGKDSKLYSDLLSVLANMTDDGLTTRWNNTSYKNNDTGYVLGNSFAKSFLLTFHRGLLYEKLKALEKQNIFVPNSRYDNRHMANLFLYAIAMGRDDGFDTEQISIVLDALKYVNCSYMDGKKFMNLDASLAKADRLMIDAGYSKDVINEVKILMICAEKKDLSDEKIIELLNNYGIDSTNIDLAFMTKAVAIMHDANCLEYTRYVTAGDLNIIYFYEKKHFKYAKVAYQLQEGYAHLDLDKIASDNLDLCQRINQSLSGKNPQVIIREIRKGREIVVHRQINSYENAFSEIDNNEVTDPLNLIDKKLKNYENLPKQVNILHFFKMISDNPLYDYLNKKIATRKNLYLKLSDIHGETHANNVALFALFIASNVGLSEIDIKTIIEASIYHDIGRESDNSDRFHGIMGANKYGSAVITPNELKANEVKILIEAHALKGLEQIDDLLVKYEVPFDERDRLIKMIKVLRDADALDRTRFKLLVEQNNLNIDYLEFECSKEIIEACQRLNYVIYKDFVQSKINSKSFEL